MKCPLYNECLYACHDCESIACDEADPNDVKRAALETCMTMFNYLKTREALKND